MTKVKELTSFIVFFLVIGAAFSLYISKQNHARVLSPAFVYDEVVVHKAVSTASEVKTISIAKTAAVPQPGQPTSPALPIVPPRVISQILPEYPSSALEKGLEGIVMVQAMIGAGGKAEKVEVKTSSGNAEFDASAVKAVDQWTFSPASQGSAAISSLFEVPVRFSIK